MIGLLDSGLKRRRNPFRKVQRTSSFVLKTMLVSFFPCSLLRTWSFPLTRTPTLAEGKPDPKTLQAFFCTADQGINYKTGVWRKLHHFIKGCLFPWSLSCFCSLSGYIDHPMLTVGGLIDLACVETQINHKGDPRDCELLEFEEAIGTVDIPMFWCGDECDNYSFIYTMSI